MNRKTIEQEKERIDKNGGGAFFFGRSENGKFNGGAVGDMDEITSGLAVLIYNFSLDTKISIKEILTEIGRKAEIVKREKSKTAKNLN